MFFLGPNYHRLQKYLKFAVYRLRFLNTKKLALNEKRKIKVAECLKLGYRDEARIKTEFILTENTNIQVMETVQNYCSALLSKFSEIRRTNKLGERLGKIVSTVLWCSSRLFPEIPELRIIGKELAVKYGTLYAYAASSRNLSSVNERLVRMMEWKMPSTDLIDKYLANIASCHGIAYRPESPVEYLNEAYSVEGSSKRVYDSDSSTKSNLNNKTFFEHMKNPCSSHVDIQISHNELEKNIETLEILNYKFEQPTTNVPTCKQHRDDSENKTMGLNRNLKFKRIRNNKSELDCPISSQKLVIERCYFTEAIVVQKETKPDHAIKAKNINIFLHEGKEKEVMYVDI